MLKLVPSYCLFVRVDIIYIDLCPIFITEFVLIGGHSIITSRLFWQFLSPPSLLSQTVTSCWPPNDYVTFDQPPGSIDSSWSVELLSMYVNAVIFSFFPAFQSNFVWYKFSQWDRSVASHFAPTSTRPMWGELWCRQPTRSTSLPTRPTETKSKQRNDNVTV